MYTMKKRQKVTIILLLAIMVLGGAFLSIRTLNRKDLRVKVGTGEFPLIFEDGDYEDLDRARLIWTVNNLYESVYDYEVIPTDSYKFYVGGRVVELKFFLHELGRRYGPKISYEIGYYGIVEEDGIHHLILTREFIEAFIEASSKYVEVTDELNNFIDRLNRINSAEIDNLTEAEVDSMYYIDPNINEDDSDLEDRREGLRVFTVDKHYQSTNVLWIEESIEVGRYLFGENAKPMIVGEAIFYTNKDNLPWWYSDDTTDFNALSPPLNFDSRIHTDPDTEPFVWVPADKCAFLYVNGQWKIADIMPGT